jgi:dipeptidyl aminopeptidase/acylaminoacyl peptidase
MCVRLIVWVYCVCLGLAGAQLSAFSLADVLGTPFVAGLDVAEEVPTMVFSVNDHGKRNIYAASAPDYDYRQLTHYTQDDGQEISSLSVSADGRWAVFVRGGDHGANSSAIPINPTSSIYPPIIGIYSIELASGAVRPLAKGSSPIIRPDHDEVTFLSGGQVWTVPLDASSEAKPLFQARGEQAYLEWSPDGERLAFTTLRGQHSFIGIYQDGVDHLQWVAPSFYRDNRSRWSPDGERLAFIRRPTTVGELDRLKGSSYRPWSIVVADLDSGEANVVWDSPRVKEGAVPVTQGYYNLDWPLEDRITFVSFEDGWNHIYSVNPSDGAVAQITKGDFTVRYLSASTDGRYLAFSANYGDEPGLDIDRQHIGLASVATGEFEMITQGKGIESYPMFMDHDRELVLLSADGKLPTVPAVLSMDTRAALQRLQDDKLFGSFDYEALVQPEQVIFEAADGLQIHGQLFAADAVAGQGNVKRPAVVYIHGGPRRQMYLGWHFMDYYFYDYAVNQYLASRGFVVLSVNYRTGIGYGYDFQNAKGGGAKGASEYQDIVAAGEWLAQQSYVDPERIGVFGGSNGGYLTAMALGRNSDLFKAGVDIHGIHNRAKSRSGQAAKIAWESSPSRWVDTWESPVLLIHGDDDQNALFWHSLDLYNRLRIKGDVDVEVMVIPDETHHWMLYRNLLKVKERTVDFLQRQLMGESE